ncbi:hypothetical protein H0H92_006471, partial [Tricholoma furcatifolium]
MWRYLFAVAGGEDPMKGLPSLLGELKQLVCNPCPPWFHLTNDRRTLQANQSPATATSSIALINDSPLTLENLDPDIRILGSMRSANGLGPILPKHSPPPSPDIGGSRLPEHSSSSPTPPPTVSMLPMALDGSIPSPPSPHPSDDIGGSSPENSSMAGTTPPSASIAPMAADSSIPSTVQSPNSLEVFSAHQARNSQVGPTACAGKDRSSTGIKGVREEGAQGDESTAATQEDVDAELLPDAPSSSETPGALALLRINPVGVRDDFVDRVPFTPTATGESGANLLEMDPNEAMFPDLSACRQLLTLFSEPLQAYDDLELPLAPAATGGPSADPAGSDMDISGGEQDFDFDSDDAENESQPGAGVAEKEAATGEKKKESAGSKGQKESSEGETEKESTDEESEEESAEEEPENESTDEQRGKNLPEKSGAPGPPAPKPLRGLPEKSGAPGPPAPKPLRRSSRERKPSRGQVPEVRQQASGSPRKRKRNRLSHEEPEENKPPLLEDTDEEDRDPDGDPPLDVDVNCPIIEGYSIRMPMTGKPGANFQFTPTFQLQEDLDLFVKVHKAAMARPDEKSMVHVMDHAQFLQTGPQEIAEIFKDNACIFLVDCPVSDFQSDAHMMSSIAPLNRRLRLQDFMFSGIERPRRGRTQHLLDHNDRMLSALNLPAVVDEFERFPVFSDQKAWLQAAGRSYCSEKEPYPVPDMRWYLASTGSFHEWHVDSNGLATFVFPMSGIKLWYIGTPKSRSFSDFRKVNLFTNGYENSLPNLGLWDVEVLVLSPGTGLIMRPQLPHLVYTPKIGLTVCKGGHFYFTGMLKDSIIGVYHHAISALMITNTEHTESCHACLTRLLVAINASIMGDSSLASDSHDLVVPDVTTWEGIVHVFFLCIYFELCGALQMWSWEEKNKLASVIKDRIRSRELVCFICSGTTFRYGAKSFTGTRAVREVFGRLLAQHAYLLIKLKEAALQQEHQGQTNHTLRGFEADVLSCLRGGIRYGLDCFNDLRKQSCAYDSFEPNLVFGGEVVVHQNEIPSPVDMEFIGNVELACEPAFHSLLLDNTQGAVSGDEAVAFRLGIAVPKPP